MENQKYHLSARIIHWIMALIIIFLLALGFYMTNFLSKEASYKMTVYNLHKSFGALVLFLIVARIFIRFYHLPPKFPKTMHMAVQKLAHLVHFLLYALMILMPLSGYLLSNYYGYDVHLFGIALPNLVEKNPDLGHFFAETHEFLGITFAIILTLHIAGALKHRFFDKSENNVFKRMV